MSELDTLESLGHYAVRIGIHGQVGRFSDGGQRYRRGSGVICRTARGLEVGTVLNPISLSLPQDAPAREPSAEKGESLQGADGRLIRPMTAEDHLLWNQLKQIAQSSFEACQTWLNESGARDQLLEVEPLYDGRTIYFHFLSDVSSGTAAELEKLVAIFQQTVAASPFAKLLDEGCGPGCGTAQASRGCGTACASCAVACRTR